MTNQNQNQGLGLAGLADLLQKPVVNGVWYNGKHIVLDGYKFVQCRFDNCQLHISSPNFELERCFVDPSTRVTYGEAPLRVIRLFNSPYQWFYENMPVFAPTRHEDGTISIAG